MATKLTSDAGVCWRTKTKKIGRRSIKFMEPFACVEKKARGKEKPKRAQPKRRRASKSAGARRSR